jgi:hypothetical protein
VPNYPGFGLTGDYYFIDDTMVEQRMTDDDGAYYDLKLHWYLGAGLFLNMHPYSRNAAYFYRGVRVPVGLSWHIIETVELFLSVVPNIGLANWVKNPFHFGVNGEIGLRYWFTNSDG